MTLVFYCKLNLDGRVKKQEKCFEFVSDIDELKIKKGDYLIGVHPKDGSRSTDVRSFDQETLDDLLSNAMRGKYLIFRIVKKDHEDCEKFLNVRRVRRTFLIF